MMHTLRLLLLLSTSLLAASLLLYASLEARPPYHTSGPKIAAPRQGGFKALVSFNAPGSLFPPSAIISLTDDNSTFFLARPAAFGPDLPKDGLSSLLWVGSGFGDDALGNGELGCSDSLDWNGREGADYTPQHEPEVDIKFRQDNTDIQGKVVLLKRGDCGFLAKVLWAQGRGAVAVVVGDNVRGGGLVRMYAKGDTSNVTIPSVFTSHTTAHLLSSLLPRRGTKRTAPGKVLEHQGGAHDGLWVTLIPTTISTSPFFDTLLVLVVSPLVTLTVVYALLLLRSRIRRRRWRAPKSLVERLPVRTYQTISTSSSSPASSSSSVTTPLLQHTSGQSHSPVADTVLPSNPETPGRSDAEQRTSRLREEEKRETGLAEWRRRYGGRQRECVVCLEEYVAGVSQVMSLPCGHEFHADCITPWLVTRRRTCPICKGDVVRSLAQSYRDRSPQPSTTHTVLHSPNVDDVQAQAAEERNDSPSSALPIPLGTTDDDIEANRDSSPSFGSTITRFLWRGTDAARSGATPRNRRANNVVRHS